MINDNRVCAICDGGPGNDCACNCGMQKWDTELSHHTGVGQPWLRTYDAHLKGGKYQEATMADEPQIDDEDLLAVHLNGFASGREHERKRIVAWLRGETGCAWSRDVIAAADAIEAGEHLKCTS